MPESQATEPSPVSSEFASLLARLTSAQFGPASSEEPWDDSALAKDVATISYEPALHTHSRAIQSPGPSIHEPDAGASSEENHRGTSISIRLSRSERAQLRQRAAEAGLSVSAYLRSCIFEAESLRAQVRETLSQFRSATSSPSGSPTPIPQAAPVAKSKAHRLWPFGNRNRTGKQ
jgi:hypothetical protein